ncbi:hypothetical protein BWI93_07710 [Siphonobacter sp. BAB-5385]|uniref:hypothetical protein n=1 Tax=Siphonobacter sp. BAB-5385 TaxID=1864822 RepID=UPI000B9DD7D1|nr:hypothetical protein [Siphonobacter sp. BAB-5385]OZI08731.1 hypothetical protein BWI93_07710 [Siphonobacter sp. BAB-5385]
MKHFCLVILLLALVTACSRDAVNGPVENSDWIRLTSPENSDVQAVYGTIDSTLIMISNFKIYHTKDQGKTWTSSPYPVMVGLTGFLATTDTLFALTATSGIQKDGTIYANAPRYYSLDQGITWQAYNGFSLTKHYTPLNKLHASNGVVYSVDELRTPINGGSTNYYLQTVGLQTSTGKKIPLPQEHQIKSITMDSRGRLYVAGSAAVCGGLRDFHFCNGQRGVIYVSKKALP